jgi:hypothetical protein
MRVPRHSITTTPTGLLLSVYRLITRSRWIQNRGISRPYDEARALRLIDPRICNLVAKLNIEGIVATFACCEGHWPDDVAINGGTVSTPYVGFDSSIEFAARLNRALIHASPLEPGALNHHWAVEYGGGCFVLRAHVDDAPNRALLDADFAVIGRLVDEIITGTHTLRADSKMHHREGMPSWNVPHNATSS